MPELPPALNARPVLKTSHGVWQAGRVNHRTPDLQRPSKLQLLATFLGLGCRAWGGPVAQIAMIRRALVEEGRWVEAQRFNRLLAVYQALPGPEALELCVHLGLIRAGRIGGLIAGLGFLMPGLALTLIVAALYARLDTSNPLLAAALAGAQLSVVALVLGAARRLAGHVLTDAATVLAAAVGASLSLLLPVPSLEESSVAGAAALSSFALFLAGLKGGLLSFGGAYAAIPVVRADLVGPGRLNDATFLDGLGFANLLPAPLILFATFSTLR